MTFDASTRRTGNVLIASSLLCFSGGVYYYAVTQGRKKLDKDVHEAIAKRRRLLEEQEGERREMKKKKRWFWRSSSSESS